MGLGIFEVGRLRIWASAACRRCPVNVGDAEETAPAKDRPRARVGSVLGNTMMRRMIGRDKGFRCAGMVAGGKGSARN